MSKRYCVYAHKNGDQIFYVGMGVIRGRPFNTSGRSDLWINEAKKDFDIEIIELFDDRIDAAEAERRWISQHSPKCNIRWSEPTDFVEIDNYDELSPEEMRTYLHQLLRKAGSQTSLADDFGVSKSYISQVLAGDRDPGKAILEPLGLERIVSYRRKSERSNGKANTKR